MIHTFVGVNICGKKYLYNPGIDNILDSIFYDHIECCIVKETFKKVFQT